VWSVSLLVAVSLSADPRPDAGASEAEAQRALESIRAAHLEVRAELRLAQGFPEWSSCVTERLGPLARLRHHAEAVRTGRVPLSAELWRGVVARAQRLLGEVYACRTERSIVVWACPGDTDPPGDPTEWKPPPPFTDRPVPALSR
jgi:hypothetical protein